MKYELDRTLRDILDGIRTQPGRIGLSFLAILVGIIALTILLSVLGGLEERSQRIVQEFGANVFGITQPAEDGKSARGRRLMDRHVQVLDSSLDGSLVAGLRTYDVPTLGTRRRVKVVAADSGLLDVRGWRMRSGRFLDAQDLVSRARYAVVSADLSRAWGWKLGDAINLESTPFQVIGVVDSGSGALEAEGSDPGLALSQRTVFVPRTVPAYWSNAARPRSHLDAIFVRVRDERRFAEMVSVSRSVLSQPDQQTGQLSMITPATLLRRIRRLQTTIKLTVGSIAFLCLILGGTTLMSLMVANVRDRVVEIGLRRALGATAGDIAGLFVCEACLVTAAAAVVGTSLTHVVLWLGAARFPVPVSQDLSSVLAPVMIAVGLGFAFSYWPARSAARITPSEALRND